MGCVGTPSSGKQRGPTGCVPQRVLGVGWNAQKRGGVSALTSSEFIEHLIFSWALLQVQIWREQGTGKVAALSELALLG